MLSSNETILETLSLLRQHGVRDFVLCPGSRNAGIVHSVCQIEDFRTHTATDERCAGFMAIGLALATGRGVAVVVTSGSALANLYPAACEAFHQHVPVIFISADRPAEWLGQMDGQTMPQDGALGKMVKMGISLPEGNTWHANRLVNEALLCCLHRKPQGPVHINMPISEPIYDFRTTSLPMARTIRLTDGVSEIKALTATACKGCTVILCGQMRPDEVPDNDTLEETARRFTVIAENLSNMPHQYRTNPSCIDWARMPQADRVITLGGHIISKELKQFFRTHCPAEHWHVSPDGAVADVFCCQTQAVKAETRDFLAALLSCPSPQREIVPLPLRQQTETDTANEDSRIGILVNFFSLLPQHSAVHLANSSTVRLAQVAMDRAVQREGGINAPHVFCNRGINGIEGSLSVATGYAQAMPERQVYAVTGDLSFFYDSNALWCTPMPANLHIMVFNDGHGSIFDTLPQPTEPPKSRQAIAGTHYLSASHIAQLYGIRYLCGREHMEDFINTRDTIILEITADGWCPGH